MKLRRAKCRNSRSPVIAPCRLTPQFPHDIRGCMSLDRLRNIVNVAVPMLFAQIEGGRIRCESEATLQLHLGRIIATVADLLIVGRNEAFSIELEKPLASGRGRIDIWFALANHSESEEWRCAMELKFFRRKNQKEPNNRYDVFKDIHRLERVSDIADLGFMLVVTDHPHYINWQSYSEDTRDFDFRDGRSYLAGTTLTYRTGTPQGDPITLRSDYNFNWISGGSGLSYMLLEVTPQPSAG